MQPLLGAVARSAGGDEEVGEAGGGAALPQRRVQRRLERGQRRCLTTCRHRLWLSHQRILCHRRHTESRTRRREVRHSMRQDEGVCGRKPSSTRRHVRARGSTGEHSWCACDFRSWVLLSRCEFLGFGETRVAIFRNRILCTRKIALLPPNRFASRHLYQFQERSCCPPIPGRTLKLPGIGGLK